MQKLFFFSQLNLLLYALASLCKTDCFGSTTYTPTYNIKMPSMYRETVCILETQDKGLQEFLDKTFLETRFVEAEDDIFTSIIKQ